MNGIRLRLSCVLVAIASLALRNSWGHGGSSGHASGAPAVFGETRITVRVTCDTLESLGLDMIGVVQPDDSLLFLLQREGTQAFLSSSSPILFDRDSLAAVNKAIEQLRKAGPGLEKSIVDAAGAKLVVVHREAVAPLEDMPAQPECFTITRSSSGMFSTPNELSIPLDATKDWVDLETKYPALARTACENLRKATDKTLGK